jgi:hypothetical protein
VNFPTYEYIVGWRAQQIRPPFIYLQNEMVIDEMCDSHQKKAIKINLSWDENRGKQYSILFHSLHKISFKLHMPILHILIFNFKLIQGDNFFFLYLQLLQQSSFKLFAVVQLLR